MTIMVMHSFSMEQMHTFILGSQTFDVYPNANNISQPWASVVFGRFEGLTSRIFHFHLFAATPYMTHTCSYSYNHIWVEE